MGKGNRKPLRSWMSVLVEDLVSECEKRKRVYLRHEEVEEVAECIMGATYPVGTDMDEIYKKLERYRFIFRIRPTFLGEMVTIPLGWR